MQILKTHLHLHSLHLSRCSWHVLRIKQDCHSLKFVLFSKVATVQCMAIMNSNPLIVYKRVCAQPFSHVGRLLWKSVRIKICSTDQLYFKGETVQLMAFIISPYFYNLRTGSTSAQPSTYTQISSNIFIPKDLHSICDWL